VLVINPFVEKFKKKKKAVFPYKAAFSRCSILAG
jgi:hypothetical protein